MRLFRFVAGLSFFTLLVFGFGCGGGGGGGDDGGTDGGVDDGGGDTSSLPTRRLTLTGIHVDSDPMQSRYTVEGEPGSFEIYPDTLRVAYRLIALLPETAVDQIESTGVRGTEGQGGFESYDYSTTGLYDGFSYEEGRLEAFIPSAQWSDFDDNAFIIADRTGSGEEPVVFNLSDAGIGLNAEEFPALDTNYSGLALMPVYYEAEIDGYGLIRLYIQDEGDFRGGDFVFKEDGSTAWKWIYIRMGDGIDQAALDNAADNNDADPHHPSYGGVPIFLDESISEKYPATTFYTDYFEGDYPDDADSPPTGPSAGYHYWIMNHDLLQYLQTKYQEETNPADWPIDSGDWDSDPGGYWGTPSDNNTVAGRTNNEGENVKRARMIYYEPDNHAGASDLPHIYLSNTRLTESEPDYAPISTEDDPPSTVTPRWCLENYQDYAFDSGLIVYAYEDSESEFFEDYDSSYRPRMTQIMPNTFTVYAGQTYSCPTAATEAETVVMVEITAFIKSHLSCVYEEEGGASFEEKYMSSYSPHWYPVGGTWPSWVQNDFKNGNPLTEMPSFLFLYDGDWTTGNVNTSIWIEFGFLTGAFDLEMVNIPWSEVNTMPPLLHPEPGIFDPDEGGLQVTFTVENESDCLFYTTDGTDPAVDSSGNALGTTMRNDSHESISVSEDTLLKVAAKAEGKALSTIISAEYIFQAPAE